jgi:endonuclease III
MDRYKKTFAVFKKHYVLVPLQVFSNNPYKTLVATMMSARTNDDTTVIAAERLFKKAPDVYALHNLSDAEIQKLIYPVGFYKTKARHLKQLASKIIDEFEGKVPKTREELVSLSGVGRKTANLVLNRAFGIPAIAVDIHVHRITNMLRWVDTKTPEKTEIELMKIIPQSMWPDLNRLFVSIGRQFRSHKKLKAFLVENNLTELRRR